VGPLAGLSLILAHGGIPGLIAETGSVFVALAIFGYFIRRSAKREKEEEKNRKGEEKNRKG
jgi:hypothetical protein